MNKTCLIKCSICNKCILDCFYSEHMKINHFKILVYHYR